ncbi:hypothetical protein QTP86_004947 [Hemibagrus guttatus]|nr:hypothetical protein QTP86_004947 [Hemibagrus guttatus]
MAVVVNPGLDRSGDVITRRHTVDMSNLYRDLLTKSLYGRLFSVLVNNVNSYLQGQDESLGDPSLEISILDIFGFEKFQKNNFEQLCVNMVNERIQQYTTELLFQQEQQECLQEGVAMETVRSPACQPALVDFFYQQVLTKPQGMLCVLDEESQSLRPSELNLYKRLQVQLESTATDVVLLTTKDGNGNPQPKDQGPSFTVAHYTGKMSYDLTGSLERNRDALPQNILFVLKSSENVLVHQMFQCKLTQTGSLVPPNQRLQLRRSKGALLLHMPSSASTPKDAHKYLELKKLMKKKGATSFMQRLERCGPVTVAVQLRNSLSEISSRLQLCTPHFVHCVRPNSSGQADGFDSSLVSTQLQYVGVLEMVRMIRYGYPVRMPFTSFLTRTLPHYLSAEDVTGRTCFFGIFFFSCSCGDAAWFPAPVGGCFPPSSLPLGFFSAPAGLRMSLGSSARRRTLSGLLLGEGRRSALLLGGGRRSALLLGGGRSRVFCLAKDVAPLFSSAEDVAPLFCSAEDVALLFCSA